MTLAVEASTGQFSLIPTTVVIGGVVTGRPLVSGTERDGPLFVGARSKSINYGPFLVGARSKSINYGPFLVGARSKSIN